MLVLAQRLKWRYRPAAAPASQVWSVVGVLAVGVILMFVAPRTRKPKETLK
jgi:hypothetical protein